MLVMPIAVIVPSLYIKERGVALATMGVILMIARIFDAVADQVIGYLSDVTRNRDAGRPQGLGGAGRHRCDTRRVFSLRAAGAGGRNVFHGVVACGLFCLGRAADSLHGLGRGAVP